MRINAKALSDCNRVRVVSDVHGNFDGLKPIIDSAPEGTFFLFLGDLTDRGDDSISVVNMVHKMIFNGRAVMVQGNHDNKIFRYARTWLAGEEIKVKLTHGLSQTIDQVSVAPRDIQEKFFVEIFNIVEHSPDYIQLGDWVFAHGAVLPEMIGKDDFRSPNERIRTYALYGEVDGFRDDGYPIRKYDWVKKLPRRCSAVVGHDVRSMDAPVVEDTGNGGQAIFLDTGSGKGGKISYLDFATFRIGDGSLGVGLISKIG